MTFRLGLTGSIGMGKSTTAALLKEEGCAIWDADAAVHRLYSKGGLAVAPMAAAFPEAIMDGAVSRDTLKAILRQSPARLSEIETIVHPLVAQDRKTFLETCSADIAVLDIPLLFETGAQDQMDAVLCVSVSPEIQEKRVMARANMTEDLFQSILAKQMPDAEKRERSDYVVITDTIEHAREQVQTVLQEIRQRISDA